MRSLIVLGIAFTGLSISGVYAQDEVKGDLDSYDAAKVQKNDSTKPHVAIGMNLINSDGSSMGTYVLNESDKGQQYNTVSKDFPQEGIDNEKYVEAMKTGKYAETEEVTTCRLGSDNRDERN